MKRIEYSYVDKSKWADGPWQKEPDKIQWLDKATNLPCLIVRQPSSGHLCGYVGVTEGHPHFGKDYDAPDVSVHGGLTYADFCVENEKEHGICHLTEPGDVDRVWWFGFDCAHGGDLGPAYTAFYSELKRALHCGADVYRDIEYVERQTRSLAKQLKVIAKAGR